MKGKDFRRLLLLCAALAFAGGSLYAQEQTSQQVWRKRVERRVRVHKSITEVADKDRLSGWEDFFRQLVSLAGEERIPCFSAYDKSRKIFGSEIKQMVGTVRDTVLSLDSVGVEQSKVRERAFSYGLITRIKLAEDWTYDPVSSQTEIQITHVAVMREVYGDDGDYRGVAPMFWMKWGDFRRYLEHEGSLKLESIEKAIFKDYFLDSALVKENIKLENASGGSGGYEKTVMRKTRRLIDTCGTSINPNLADVYDSSAGQILYEHARLRNLKVYSNEGHRPGRQLSPEELPAMVKIDPDTIAVDDPASGTEIIKIVLREFDFRSIDVFGMLERWTFDAHAGRTLINYEWVLPMKTVYNINGCTTENTPMFWVRYNEAKAALKRYNEYVPGLSLEWVLWNDRFNEVKRP